MNELQVTVNQTPGVIRWNFEELKTELAAQMDQYKAIVYTDDNVGDAKRDVAALRKLSKAVNDRKIEIKKKCLEPYEAIEAQAKELMSLIDEPIALINAKVNDYEKRRREARKAKIMDAMHKAFEDLPADIRKRLEFKTYDPRWENATATEKSYRDAIQKAHDEVVDALRLLQNVDEDYRDEVMEAYKIDLDATRAMLKAQELAKQKERLLERERQRQELERLRLEQAKKAEEAKAVEQKQEPHVTEQAAPTQTVPVQEPARQESEETDGKSVYTILFRGTKEQMNKVLSYIKYVGADYQVR